jgi:hypothetical protein
MNPVTTASTQHPSAPGHQGCTDFQPRQLSRRVTLPDDGAMAGHGVTFSPGALLRHVHKLGPPPPGVSAGRMETETFILTRNLQPGGRFEARGCVVPIASEGRALRTQPTGHRRAARLALNPQTSGVRVADLHSLPEQGWATCLPERSGGNDGE